MAARLGNLVELLGRSREAFAARPLFGTKRADGWSWTTYDEFFALVVRCRAGLSSLGIEIGDKVAIVSRNRVEWAAVAHAAYGLGAAIVPMYEAQSPSEREFILADSGAKVVFAANDAIAETVRPARPKLPALAHVIAFDSGAGAPSFAGLLEGGGRTTTPAISPQQSLPAALLYTSGTTGLPKGVILSHGNLVANIDAMNEIFPFEPDDRSLSFLPWAHAFGQAELNVLMSMGCSLALNRDPKELIDDLAQVKPTILVAVPRVFNRIYRAVQEQIHGRPRFVRALLGAAIRASVARSAGDGRAHLGLPASMSLRVADRLLFSKVRQQFGGRLKYAISGSAALAPDVAQFMEAIGIRVYEGYGLTETSPIVSCNSREYRRLGSAGKVLPGVRVAIDTSVGAEGDGEIVVYGPNVMQGYHNRPAENASSMGADGGFRTGDVGHFDGDGYLYVTGRIKEQFKLDNGKYVVPSVLEEALKLSRYIANVLVYGENEPYTVALVVLDAEPVQRWAREKNLELADPTTDERVRSLIEGEIRERSAGFKEYERTKAFALLAEDFSTANGLLTPTLKLKRAFAIRKFGPVLAQLYGRRMERETGATIGR